MTLFSSKFLTKSLFYSFLCVKNGLVLYGFDNSVSSLVFHSNKIKHGTICPAAVILDN